MIERGFITKPFDPRQWQKFAHEYDYATRLGGENSALAKLEGIWRSKFKTPHIKKQQAVEELKCMYWSNPLRGKIIAPRTGDRQWRLQNHDLYAIPKERSLYLKLQG